MNAFRSRSLYHYTCEHSHLLLGDGEATLVPADLDAVAPGRTPWTAYLVWLTDMRVPVREALGLTSHTLTCDRTQYRYRVTSRGDIEWWPHFARALLPSQRRLLEEEPGARPMHWWVSGSPVPVVYDPR